MEGSLGKGEDYVPGGRVADPAGDALALFPRGPVTGSPRRTVYKHTCVKVPLSRYTHPR